MRLPTVCLVSVVALSGCYPYIGKSLEEERAASLDEDGDGFPASEDCNDNDATINPDATEIAYDGIDQDCENPAEDLVDVDDDGFPGILQADYELLGDVAPWPNDVAPGPVDCDDNDDSIFPGAPDVPYNGIDEDCAADCDFNTDGDRFADKRTAAQSASDPACAEFPATDCLDTNENAFPGNPAEDVPYDGIDLNCDEVNDYDPDGDNAVWAFYQEDYNRYLTAHDYPSSNPTFDECYDVLDGALPQAGPVDPGTVSSNRVETFGDGIDGDCSDMSTPIANDFDEDGDGYMPTASRSDFLAYVERYINYENHRGDTPYKDAFTQTFGGTSAEWSGFFDTWQNDCDDTDATRNPEAIEVLGDAIDQDCDGDANTSPFVVSDHIWTGSVGGLRAGATDDHFVLVVAAPFGFTNQSGVSVGRSVANMSWDLDSDNFDAPTDDAARAQVPATGANQVNPGVSLVTFTNGYYSAWSTFDGGESFAANAVSLRSSISALNYNDGSTGTGWALSGDSGHTQTDLRCDGTSCWSVSCGEQDVQLSVSPDVKAVTGFEVTFTRSGNDTLASAADCFIEVDSPAGEPMFHMVQTDGSVDSYVSLESRNNILSSASSFAFSSKNLSHGSSHGDWLILGNSAGGVTLFRNASTQRDVLSGIETLNADAAFLGPTAYVAAVDDSNRVRFAYGNPTGAMTQVEVPFYTADGSTIAAQNVTVEVRGSRVLLAATGTTTTGDAVMGWSFFEI